MELRLMRLRKRAKKRCLLFIKIQGWTTALLIWECQLTRQFSDFNLGSANFTESSFYQKTLLKFTHRSWLEDLQKVVPMFLNLSTLVNLLVLLRVLNSTNKWLFAEICKEFLRLVQFSELNSRSQTDIFASSLVSIWKWKLRTITLKHLIWLANLWSLCLKESRQDTQRSLV
jgi:hypothetical protein